MVHVPAVPYFRREHPRFIHVTRVYRACIYGRRGLPSSHPGNESRLSFSSPEREITAPARRAAGVR